jgi:hypothetical protein
VVSEEDEIPLVVERDHAPACVLGLLREKSLQRTLQQGRRRSGGGEKEGGRGVRNRVPQSRARDVKAGTGAGSHLHSGA